jgi:hypothetical protein
LVLVIRNFGICQTDIQNGIPIGKTATKSHMESYGIKIYPASWEYILHSIVGGETWLTTEMKLKTAEYN